MHNVSNFLVLVSVFQSVMLSKSRGGLYYASTMEERRKRKAKRREIDPIKFIDLRFERWQLAGFRKARRRLGYSINCMF